MKKRLNVAITRSRYGLFHPCHTHEHVRVHAILGPADKILYGKGVAWYQDHFLILKINSPDSALASN